MPRFYHLSSKFNDYITRNKDAPLFYRDTRRHLYMDVLEDDYAWLKNSWVLKKFSYLYEPLSSFISQIYEHGIYDYIERREIWHFEKPEDEDPRKVLTIEMLSAGFVIWLCCVLVSIIVFICELGSKKFSRCKPSTSTSTKKYPLFKKVRK